MIKHSSLRIALIATLVFGTMPNAFGQFLDGDGGGGGGGDEALESDEGLQSATPTDNVNELNSGGNPANAGGGDPGEGNFPAASQSGEDFDIEDTGDEGGNDFFTNDQPGNGAGQAAPSAFGGGGPDAAGEEAAKPDANPPKNATLPEPVPANAGNPTAAPTNNVPANAGALMNQLDPAANPAATNPAATNPAAPVEGAQPATGQEELVQKPAEPPPIEAPPLPPPNEFAGAPPVPGTMRLMAEGEAPEEYQVQPGDTLFDICDQLLDEPAYWPKLWALNPEIRNPHFIFPNMRLKFYPGDDETPPYLQVITEDDVIPIDKGELDEQELVAEKVIFPESVAQEYLTEVIGPSQVEPLEEEIEVAGRRYQGGDLALQVPGFIFGQEKEPLGYIISGRNGEQSLAPGQFALIEAASGISAGNSYSVLRAGEEVESPETGDFVGYKYYYVADVKVVRGIEDEVYVASVSNSRLTIRPDDIVVNLVSVNRTIPDGSGVGSLAGVDASIVGFQYFGQEVGGTGAYAFIDKGNGDGVSPGMYLPVYATPGFLSLSTGTMDIPEDYVPVGVIRIIDATDAGAVGYVVRNSQELRVGDRTGKG